LKIFGKLEEMGEMGEECCCFCGELQLIVCSRGIAKSDHCAINVVIECPQLYHATLLNLSVMLLDLRISTPPQFSPTADWAGPTYRAKWSPHGKIWPPV